MLRLSRFKLVGNELDLGSEQRIIDVPAHRGNLFRPGTPRTRPEIYAMGLRNPFRFSVNRTNGHVYMADYSPDAPVANPLRGPAGHGRWMLIRKQPPTFKPDALVARRGKTRTLAALVGRRPARLGLVQAGRTVAAVP